MKKEEYTLDLEIAGFVIRLYFHQAQLVFLRSQFIKSVKNINHGFILTNFKGITDCVFHIYENRHHILFLKDKKNKDVQYNLVQKKDSKRKYITFYDISIHLFTHLIFNAVSELISEKGFILHSSAVNYYNSALLFLGPSGAGKSTVAKLLNSQHPMLGDDISIIRKNKAIFSYFQTPLIEKNHLIQKGKITYPLKGLFFLKKSKSFRIVKIKGKKLVLHLLSKQLMGNPTQINTQMKYLFEFVHKEEDFYFLYFAKNAVLLENLIKSNFSPEKRRIAKN